MVTFARREDGRSPVPAAVRFWRAVALSAPSSSALAAALGGATVRALQIVDARSPQRLLPEDFQLDDKSELSREWDRNVVEALTEDRPLGPLHVYALSHVLRRPIVVYAAGAEQEEDWATEVVAAAGGRWSL